MKKILLSFIFLFVSGVAVHCLAQDSASAQPEGVNNPNWGTKKMIIVGGAEAMFVADTGQSNFRNIKFHLSPMVRLSEKLFLISEIEIETGDGVADFGLEQVHFFYELAPNLSLYAGRFLPKFGHYRGMIGEGYINRFPTDPVGFGDGGIGPMVEDGIGIVGGLQLGYSKLNYDFYLSNGPALITGANGSDPGMAGQFDYEAYLDNNKGKAFGGRIGFLPFSNSSLEIGASMLMSSKTGDQNSEWEKVGATWWALDANYFTLINPIKSTLRLNFEYKGMNVDKANYLTSDENSITFDNKSTCYYFQGSLRPNVQNRFLSSLEVAVRHSEFEPPKDAPWGGSKLTQTAFGLNYWLAWDCILKLTYQQQSDMSNTFLAQIIYRF
jgi:hypothetical protein